MKTIELNNIKKEHNFKIGDKAPEIEPNFYDDAIFIENGKPIGFFLKKIPEKMRSVAEFCNNELLSDRVPKSEMVRSSSFTGNSVKQFSTILGGVPPKPNMRRTYATISSVHSVKTAETFIKGMKLLAKLAEDQIKATVPEVYQKQKQIFDDLVDPKFKISDLFTSSISNFNIAAPHHIDRANIKETVNVIITKRKNSRGGNLFVPDYDICFDCEDSSMIVYPAWKSMHSVTEIRPISAGGYRNSLVFYPLKAFLKNEENNG